MNPAVKWIGGAFLALVVLLFVALFVIGTMMETGVFPSDRVVTGAELGDRHITILKETGLLEPEETLELFFSEGIFSVKEGGSFITDQRVVAYGSFESVEDLEPFKILHEDLKSVEQTQQGDALNFAVYEVYSVNEGEWLELWLPHELDDDKRFVKAVKDKMSR